MHGEQRPRRQVLRHAVAGAHGPAPAALRAAQHGEGAVVDGLLVPHAEEIHVQAAQQGDAAVVALVGLLNGQDLVLKGVLGFIPHRDDVVHHGVQVPAGVQEHRPPGGVRQVHDFPVPGEDVAAHHLRGQEGLGAEAPVVVGGDKADAIVLQRQAVIADEPLPHGVKQAPGQLRIVIQHDAHVFIAGELDDVFQHAARAHHHQLHAPGEVPADVPQEGGFMVFRLRPDESLKARLIGDDRAVVEGAGVLCRGFPRETEGRGVHGGVVVAHLLEGLHREARPAQRVVRGQPFPVDRLVQRQVHEQLKEHRPLRLFPAEDLQQLSEIRLVSFH